MSLLDDLRGVGEQLAEDAIPGARESVPILGALIAHLETKGQELATVELDKLAAKFKPPEPPPAGAPPAPEASGPIATEGAAEGPSKAQLEAELAQAKAQAAATPPVVLQTEPPPA